MGAVPDTGQNLGVDACLVGIPGQGRGQKASAAGDIPGWQEAIDKAKSNYGYGDPNGRDNFLGRCHSVACQFGGSGRAANLSPCIQKGANTGADSMMTFEDATVGALVSGQAVMYDVTLTYANATTNIPYKYSMWALGQYVSTGKIGYVDIATVQNAGQARNGMPVNLGK